MTSAPLRWGDIVLVVLPGQHPRGREQEGLRPAVVVGIPPQPLRFPLLLLAPLTSQRGPWAEAHPELYPSVGADSLGLRKPSIVLMDQIRACDLSRIRARIGKLDRDGSDRVRTALQAIFAGE